MNDERIKARSLLRFENLDDGFCFERVGGKPVNSLGWQSDNIAISQPGDRHCHCRSEKLRCRRWKNVSVHVAISDEQLPRVKKSARESRE